ncbi:hypothetical protein Cni_G25855 [Canna indica]|uniref:C3H1-type domain-containing protein n=1 Tax=Canna indica TaxID=4628 RepID=A0AAQ3L2L2_9LILI|nr:hypothetical protein Cni_G25855 [Canna indica]
MVPGERTPRRPIVQGPRCLFGAEGLSAVSGLPGLFSPRLLGEAALAAALQRFLPRNGAYACSDEFRMYEFKVRRCARARSHDWTECPYAHPGEKARRRDPRMFHYSGNPCPDFRRGGGCRRGDACDLAHGVFESWLHPARYRTQPCKDGPACARRVCFFAHSPEQLRLVFPASPTSPRVNVSSSSPTSTLVPALVSPPSDGSPPVSPVGVEGVTAAMRKLQLRKVKLAPPQSGTRRGGASLLVALGNGWMTQGEMTSAADEWEAAWRLRARLLEAWRWEEEEAAPDLGWVSELVKD